MNYVYILRCGKDDGFYIGYTKDLKKRFEQHAKGHSTATKYRLPVKLVYYEAFINNADARAREEYLKSGYGRTQLKNILKNFLGT
ncbi:MAG: GIY-YIG nuclease family protein [Patescibacteria group bacterium]